MTTTQKTSEGLLLRLISTGIIASSFSACSYAQSEVQSAFNCDTTFPTSLSIEQLIQAFGAANVTDGEISLGEGFYESGTVLFANTVKNRVEILWLNTQEQHTPKLISISGNESNWIASGGISLGTDLTQLEKINRYPFRLAGFSWDYGGTILSWGKGDLSHVQSECRLGLRLQPDYNSQSAASWEWQKQVQGDREYSSGHPAMQILNPTVFQMVLRY